MGIQGSLEEVLKADPSLPEKIRKGEQDVEAKNKAAAEEGRKRLAAAQAMDAMVSSPRPDEGRGSPTPPPGAAPPIDQAEAGEEEEPLDPKIAAMIARRDAVRRLP